MAGPLLGIRVLDLTQGVAGPYATKLLSDYGADVVKVERPDGGDPTRRVGPFPDDVPHLDRSGLFFELNSGKRSVTLNLATATGRRILQRLAADADLVIESFRPGRPRAPRPRRRAARGDQPRGGTGAAQQLRAGGPVPRLRARRPRRVRDGRGARADRRRGPRAGADRALRAALPRRRRARDVHHRRGLRLAPHRARRARRRVAVRDPRELDGPGRSQPRRIPVLRQPHDHAVGEPAPQRDAQRGLPLHRRLRLDHRPAPTSSRAWRA